MKVKERNEAIFLRQQGVSIGDIAVTLGVAKSSVSLWVRDVSLTKVQLSTLNKNGHRVSAIEKRRTSRLQQTQSRRESLKAMAALEAVSLSKQPLWCIGMALYWGEGGKTQQVVRISNSDSAVIKTMMYFFKQYCNVPSFKFRGQVHTFAHYSSKEAEKYWSDVSGIPIKQFYKTYKKQSSASLEKRNNLPHGTFQIYINDTALFYRMMGWLDYIKKYYD